MTALGRARGRRRTCLITTCVALVVAAIADAATGYDGPGPFIYPAVAVVVALVPGRWTPLLATATSAFFLYGGLVSPGSVSRLTDPGAVGSFAAVWLQLCGFAVALVASVLGVVSRMPVTTRSS